LTWIFQFTYSSTTENAMEVMAVTHEQRLNMIRGRSKFWLDPWKSALEWLQDGTEVPTDKIYLWKHIMGWDNYGGRVTLAGDAAHATPPCESFNFLNENLDWGANVRRSWTRCQQFDTGCSELCDRHEKDQRWGGYESRLLMLMILRWLPVAREKSRSRFLLR